jgi:hypothetical protein
MLIHGSKLTDEQRKQVLAAFIYRHLDTTSKTDAAWLSKHAFHFVKDGSRLSRNRRYAEPSR